MTPKKTPRASETRDVRTTGESNLPFQSEGLLRQRAHFLASGATIWHGAARWMAVKAKSGVLNPLIGDWSRSAQTRCCKSFNPENVMTRLEFRWDHALDSSDPLSNGVDHAVLLAANIIYKFKVSEMVFYARSAMLGGALHPANDQAGGKMAF